MTAVRAAASSRSAGRRHRGALSARDGARGRSAGSRRGRRRPRHLDPEAAEPVGRVDADARPARAARPRRAARRRPGSRASFAAGDHAVVPVPIGQRQRAAVAEPRLADAVRDSASSRRRARRRAATAGDASRCATRSPSRRRAASASSSQDIATSSSSCGPPTHCSMPGQRIGCRDRRSRWRRTPSPAARARARTGSACVEHRAIAVVERDRQRASGGRRRDGRFERRAAVAAAHEEAELACHPRRRDGERRRPAVADRVVAQDEHVGHVELARTRAGRLTRAPRPSRLPRDPAPLPARARQSSAA